MLLRFFSLLALFVSLFYAQPVSEEKAFRLTSSFAGKNLQVSVKIDPSVFVYAEKFRVFVDDAEILVPLPTPQIFDNTPIFDRSFSFEFEPKSGEFELRVELLGCSFEGFCYQPRIWRFSAKDGVLSEFFDAQPQPLSEVEQISNSLKSNSVLAIFAFFGYGILLSLTPCVFVMIPILSQVLATRGKANALSTSLVYVAGMACAYAVVGVVVSLFNINLSQLLQNGVVSVVFALLFVAFGLNLFGVFELPFLGKISTKLEEKSAFLTGLFGVFVLGFFASVALSPCVAAPVAAAVVFMLQSDTLANSVALGAAALFAMGCGMGLPLIAFGAAAKFLPRPGEWMEVVKKLLAFLMFAMAIWALGRHFANESFRQVVLWLYALNGVVAVVVLGLFEEAKTAWQKGFKVVLLCVLLASFITANKAFTSTDSASNQSEKIAFLKPEEVSQTLVSNEKVALYFWASWCENCKVYEELFKDESLRGDYKLFKLDLTAANPQTDAVKATFGVIAPPSILFFANGVEQSAKRVVGLIGKEALKQRFE